MKQRKTLSKWLFATIYIAVVLACIGLDQLTKYLIVDKLLESHGRSSVNVLGKFLVFRAVHNDGASFGIGRSDAYNIVFFVITVLGVPAFSYLLWRSRTRSVVGQVGFAFIVGGTIGNAIDRAFIDTTDGKFFSGMVRDFISFSIFDPVFNVADSFLVIGVFMVILALIVFDPDALIPTFKQELAEKHDAKKGDYAQLQNAAEDEVQACAEELLQTEQLGEQKHGEQMPDSSDQAVNNEED